MAAKPEVARKNSSEGSDKLSFAPSPEMLQLLMENVKDYAIIMLDPGGNVTNWTPAAERLKGYQAEEIVGKHLSTFYTKEDISDGKCERELETASREGKYEDDANGHSTGLGCASKTAVQAFPM